MHEPDGGEVSVVMNRTMGDVPLARTSFNGETKPLLERAPSKHNNARDKYPSSIPFIMVNETCERFSYYGLRAILSLYMKNVLLFSEDRATAIFHAFTVGAYTMTLFGGYLSDAVLGRYNTIFYISIIYSIGSIILSVTSDTNLFGNPPPWQGMAVGLAVIAIGTGGIKPVVSAFVGDQFTADQSHLLDHIFFLFYFCINLGSFLSTVITPIIRTQVSYSAAFGLPAILLIVATGIFFAGRKRYRQNPPAGSTLWIFVQVVSLSIKRQWELFWSKKGGGYRGLDLALERYSPEVVQDVRAALNVMLLFTPLPFFWALFDQYSTRFLFQAEQMDRNFGSVYVEADQVPAVNPLLVLLFVPLFDKLIYPLFAKRGYPLRPLQRMGAGMLLTSVSFVCAALVQMAIDNNEIDSSISASDVSGSESHEPLSTIHVLWQLPQLAILTCSEIMVSITGLELAYTQAPKSMKSLIMAAWLVTVALGNLVVVIIAEVGHMSRVREFFFFAGLMVVAAFVFMIIAYFYKYVPTEKAEKTEEK